MAQRVYLISVLPRLTELFESCVCGDLKTDAFVAELRVLRKQHELIRQASDEVGSWIDSDKVEAAGRTDDLNRASYLRPYFIQEPDPTRATHLVRELQKCSPSRVVELIRQQADSFAAFRRPEVSPTPGGAHQFWTTVRDNIEELRAWRIALASGKGIRVRELREFQPGFYRQGDFVDRVLPREEGLSRYGNRLGAMYGTLAGSIAPSWWLGRDYWLGLLAGSKLPTPDTDGENLIRVLITVGKKNPAVLFPRAGLPGFESGLDERCPGYSTGLYFPPGDVIAAIGEVLDKVRDDWNELTVKITGYPPDVADSLRQMTFEAFSWAEQEGVGLLEGDELVGSYGCR